MASDVDIFEPLLGRTIEGVSSDGAVFFFHLDDGRTLSFALDDDCEMVMGIEPPEYEG
jgi:hypothetical protein